jgi:hypothetical protein
MDFWTPSLRISRSPLPSIVFPSDINFPPIHYEARMLTASPNDLYYQNNIPRPSPKEDNKLYVSYLSIKDEDQNQESQLISESNAQEQEYEAEDLTDIYSPSSHKIQELQPSKVLASKKYKKVDVRVRPVPGIFPQEATVYRQFPNNPLDNLPPLPKRPPTFVPTAKLTEERMKTINVNSIGFLWPEEEKLFKHIMVLNEQTLAFVQTDRGTFKESYFSDYIIPTVPHVPWIFKNIPIPPGVKEEVMELLKEKIDAGVYEACQSSYRSRWFCVPKKSGKLRIVHDLQALNGVTIRDAGLPPILDDFVEPFAGRQCYTVFDLFWGFDGRKIHPKSRDMTAFYSPLGLLRLTSLPMGFTNSPAEFQKCMTFILQHEIPHVANIFIDDLPIKGPATQYLDKNDQPETLPENPGIRRFIWEHANDVHRIMHRFKEAGGTFAANKAQICLPEVLIVGHKCTPEGRLPDEEKVAKVLKWPQPTNATAVRGFTGLCGTMRIWIPNYSQLIRPLTELTRKGAEFIWTERQQEAFDTMKKIITSPQVLRPIDYSSDKPVVLSVDTSNIAVGFILSQLDDQGRKRPARYGSLPMNEREARYSQPKLELYGLYRALRHWRLYLIGVKNLQVEVDASYIKGMLNEPDLQPNAAVNRWIQGILIFDFTLVHVPATRFQGPDALSRRKPAEDEEAIEHDDSWLDDIVLFFHHPHPRELNPFVFTVSTKLAYNPYELPSWKLRQSNQDKTLIQVQHFLSTLELPTFLSLTARKRFMKKVAEYFVKGGKMFKRNRDKPPLLVILDIKKRLAILTQAHDKLGHKGEQAVFDLIRLRFFWPHLRTDVHHHISTCHECQVRSLKKLEVPPTISTPQALFQKIYIDVLSMPASGHYNFIVAARDDLSGVTEVRALTANNSRLLAKFFWEQLYCRYGAIEQVVTDNGPEVKGAFQLLLTRMNIPQVHITPYNKHANGVVERGHYILREAIIKSCEKTDGKIKKWHENLDLAAFADRITVSSTTGYSPYYLLHGTHPLLPFDLTEATFMVEGFHAGLSTSELLALRIRQLQRLPQDIKRAADALKRARLKSKEQFEKRFHHRLVKQEYKEGELVLVRNSRIEATINRFKTEPRYLGPYQVVKRTTRGNYILQELDGALHAEPYAGFRIIPYLSRMDPQLQELHRAIPGESDEEDNALAEQENQEDQSSENEQEDEAQSKHLREESDELEYISPEDAYTTSDSDA